MLSFHNHKPGLVTEHAGLCFRNLEGQEVLLHMLALTDRLPQTYSPKQIEHCHIQNDKELFLSGEGGINKSKNLNAYSMSVIPVY